MSTHPITDHATIPFPCWLWDYDTGLWRYAINRIAHQSMMIRGWTFSHYSTLPADQRPEDVVLTIAEAASTPEAAEKLFEAFYSTHRITPETEKYSREYMAYCNAMGRTAEAQMAHDDAAYPGGCMTGFICWMQISLRKFHDAHPEAYCGTALRDHDAKCVFLESLST